MVKMFEKVWPALLLSWLLIGCGGPSGEGAATATGGGGATVASVETYSGSFLGSTVTGLSYVVTANGRTSRGVTDADGGFRYTLEVDADGVPAGGAHGAVTFSIGRVTLGSTVLNGDGMRITAFDLVDAGLDDFRARVENIEKYICSFAIDPTACRSVTITAGEIGRRNAVFGPMTLAELDNETFTERMAAWSDLDIAALEVGDHLEETKSAVDALRVGEVVLTLGSKSLIADGAGRLMVRASVTDTDGQPLAGARVGFRTTAGSFEGISQPVTREGITDADGQALVMLVAPTHKTTATVTAAVGGRFRYDRIEFIAGPVDADHSGITVNPATLPADGVSTARITVSLRDANGNQVADGTGVTLMASHGEIDPPAALSENGRARFTLTAPEVSASGRLHLLEYPQVTPASVPFGVAAASGKAAAISLNVDERRISVAGSGRGETTVLTIRVLNAVGETIDETMAGYGADLNNLRVTLRTRPGGGEFLSGLARDAAGGLGSVRDGETLLVRTVDGSARVILTAGTLPGVVEVLLEALDNDGATVLASAVTPAITIASGAPHLITITEAIDEGVIDMGGHGLSGVYCRLGSALVTDRHGNAVPDGTAIGLGLIDSVIYEGFGTLVRNSADLTHDRAGSGFANTPADAVIYRNGGVERLIQHRDRLLIANAVSPGDRSRFIDSVGGAVLGTDGDFLRAETDPASRTGVRYRVGAALLGGAIHGYDGGAGCDPARLTTGSATTIGGIAAIRVTYPANRETILNGCYGYDNGSGDYSAVDVRRVNPRSAQVLVLAAANDGHATTVDKGRFCFSGMAPLTLTTDRATVSASTTRTLTVTDANDIPLPFVPVVCEFSVNVNSSGNLDVTLTPSATNSDRDGRATMAIAVQGGGGAVPDLGAITCRAADATVTVAVSVH